MADGSLLFETKLDSTGVQKGLSGIKSLASAATKGIAAIGAATTAAATATGALVKSSVQGYADYEQLVGGVETLFKDSSDTVMKYAKGAYKAAGLSANEYMNTITGFSASLLQGLGGDTKKAAQIGNRAVEDMSDNANKMGTSMESIQNAYQGFAKQNYTMLDNLKLGYGGTKEEMQRLLEDAEKLTGVHYDISNFSDVIEAIHAVQDNIGITGTTAKEAASTISGSVNMTKSAWTNLVTGMADDNADFDQLVSDFVDSASTCAENLIPRIEIALKGAGQLIDKLLPIIMEKVPVLIMDILPELVESGKKLISSIGKGIIKNAPDILEFAVDIVKFIVKGLLDNAPLIEDAFGQLFVGLGIAIEEICPVLQPLADLFYLMADNIDIVEGVLVGLVSAFVAYKVAAEAVTIAQWAMNVAMDANPIGIIILAIVALVAAIVFLWNNSDSFRQFWIDCWDNICQFFSDCWNNIISFFTETIPGFIQSIIDWFKALPENIAYLIGYLLGTFVKWGLDLVTWAKEAIPNFIDKVGTFFSELPGNIWKWLLNTIDKVKEFGKNLAQKGVEAAVGLKDSLIDGIKNLPKNFMNMGKNIVDGLLDGIKNCWGNLKKKVSDLADNLLGGFKDALGIHSPSRKFKWIGQMCVEGFEEPLEEYNPYDTLNKSMKANAGTMRMNFMANGGYGGSNTTNNSSQTFNIYQPVKSPSEMMRAARLEEQFGLAGA